MSSVISFVICRRSSRVSGVRSSASCSVTARRTRSERSSFVSVVNSCGPSFAMHAWWMRVFSSAYGSATARCSATCSPSVVCPASSTATAAPLPLPLILSERPMASVLRARQRGQELLALLCGRLGGDEGLGQLPHSPGEVGLPVRQYGRVAPVDGQGNGPVARNLGSDAHLERRLDFLALHPDLRVRPVEHDLDPVLR